MTKYGKLDEFIIAVFYDTVTLMALVMFVWSFNPSTRHPDFNLLSDNKF